MPHALQKQLWVLCIASLCIIGAYQWLDQPVVFWAASHHIRQYSLLNWFTHLSDGLNALIFIAYPVLLLRYYYRKHSYHDTALLALANSFVITLFLKSILKIIFARYWPDTWTQHNLSLLQNGAYGFNWFQQGSAYGSFPSGHVATTMAAMTLLGIAYPRLRWLAICVVILMVVGQVGLYYHFVSDVIAGMVLGYLVACAVAVMTKLTN